jgi:hypothetical protein
MQKFFFLFVVFMASQNVFAINKTWTGTTNTDWATPTNWMPNGVPTAADTVYIANVINKPVILSGATAVCINAIMQASSTLTINSGGTLTIQNIPTIREFGLNILANAILTNNGTLNIMSTNALTTGLNIGAGATVTNTGRLVINTPVLGILNSNGTFTNTATGIVTIQSFTGLEWTANATINVFTNQGTMNFTCVNYCAVLQGGKTLNNYGTISATKGLGIFIGGGKLNNLACGKILLSNTDYGIDNSTVGSVTTNAGLMLTSDFFNARGTYNNTGVVNRLPTSGTVTHTGTSAVHVRNNTIPIFAYGGTFNGTINGIFRDSLATVSAGTFAAPNTFTPLAALPRGTQTLYVRITLSGTTCPYIVPFAYQNGCIQLANATERMAWIGAASSDWSNACNWSPVGVPSATNPVDITNVTRKPIIGTGVMAMAKNILLLDTLTVNMGGTLTIIDLVTNDVGIRLRDNATLTNNGSISITSIISNTYAMEFGIAGTQTFTNSGNLTLSTTLRNVLMPGVNSSFVNTANGVINIQGGTGLYLNDATGVKSADNQGIINYSGTGALFSGKLGTAFTNSGTINITSGLGIVANGGTFNNEVCGKIIMKAGNYDNALAGSTINNGGLLQIPNNLNNTAGTFNNAGVLRYGTLTGTITNNKNSAVIVRNMTTPIFAFGGTYDGTINGIYRDSFTTVSAGKFTAPNDFIPSPTLPTGTQTLYVRITPSGEGCAYIVPITYAITRTSTKDVSDGTILHQNRPNPFSQQTLIPFVLSETNKAFLTVYDINGREVFTSNKDFTIGNNEVMLNKSIFPTTGIYFYRLTTDKYSVVRRLQFVAE